jgi:nucleoid-associated protein YgaU
MIWFIESMRHRGAVVGGCLVVLLASGSAFAKRPKPPPESIYPTEESPLEQLLKEPVSAPFEPAPTAVAPVPLETGTAVLEDHELPATAVLKDHELPVTAPRGEAKSPPAEAVAPRLNLPDHYRVWIWQENGDCLWRIAEKVYGDRNKWSLIYLANRDVIQDPNKIYPKQKLRIPSADWQPSTGTQP